MLIDRAPLARGICVCIGVGVAFRNVVHGRFYPTIGLHSYKESARVNFGATPFRFNIGAMLAVCRCRCRCRCRYHECTRCIA